MSSRLAKQSLDLLLKSKNTEKRKWESEEPKRVTLPTTKNGIKKIKYEIRYGRQQRAKARQVSKEKKANPLVALYKEEEAMDETLERNLKILRTQRLKASETEKQARVELVKLNKAISTDVAKKTSR
ncbi:hypothetical protein BX666DRAFT_1978293 [Dichotomocladium elegans]|nr:hypothetical protein BX666DRAFT_1978293 [Dichotomocladium elegans]